MIHSALTCKPVKVLIVADFSRAKCGAGFYNTPHVLCAGFTLIGCNALSFSDRDVARESTILRARPFGARKMRERLLETVRVYAPHVILFGHVDMIGPDDIVALRNVAPGVKLAQFNVDATYKERTMRAFTQRAAVLDVSFITTADPQELKRISPAPNSVAFFPNPVDPSLAVADCSELKRSELAFDGIFLGAAEDRREHQLEQLKSMLPSEYRFHAAGGVFRTPRLEGARFLQSLACAGVSPNLPRNDLARVAYLYSSDRIAQLLTNGMVALCRAEARLEELYEEGIMNYTTLEDLAGKMVMLQKDDELRRRIGATGYAIARSRTSADRVARYMLDHILEGGTAVDYGWPSERY